MLSSQVQVLPRHRLNRPSRVKRPSLFAHRETKRRCNLAQIHQYQQRAGGDDAAGGQRNRGVSSNKRAKAPKVDQQPDDELLAHHLPARKPEQHPGEEPLGQAEERQPCIPNDLWKSDRQQYGPVAGVQQLAYLRRGRLKRVFWLQTGGTPRQPHEFQGAKQPKLIFELLGPGHLS